MNYTEYINKVGLKVNTLLSPFVTSHYGEKGSRVFIGRSGHKIEAFVNEINWANSKDGEQ